MFECFGQELATRAPPPPPMINVLNLDSHYTSQKPNPSRSTTLQKYDGPIFLPFDIYKQMVESPQNALRKYNEGMINQRTPRKV